MQHPDSVPGLRAGDRCSRGRSRSPCQPISCWIFPGVFHQHIQRMQNLKHRLKRTALGKSSFQGMIALLRQPCPRPWLGAHCDAPLVPEREISPQLHTGTTAQSQPGDARAAGAEPPGASELFKEFLQSQKRGKEKPGNITAPDFMAGLTLPCDPDNRQDRAPYDSSRMQGHPGKHVRPLPG